MQRVKNDRYEGINVHVYEKHGRQEQSERIIKSERVIRNTQ